MPVEHIGLGRVTYISDVAMPKDFPVRRIVSHQISARVARKQQSARGSQHAVRRCCRLARDSDASTPPFLSCNPSRLDNCPAMPSACSSFAAQPHGAARVGFCQVVHRVSFVRRHVHQPGVRAVRRRRPVRRAAVIGRHQRPGNDRILRGIRGSPVLVVHLLRPVHCVGDLTGDQVLAGDPIQT